jgi:hypothetical protein
MAIQQYLRNESTFDMSGALEGACKALDINGDARARETVTVRIIELARRGERDPTKLRERVVNEANGATAPWQCAPTGLVQITSDGRPCP